MIFIDRDASSLRSVLSNDSPFPPIPCDDTFRVVVDDDDLPQINVTFALFENNFLCLALIAKASSTPAAPRPTT